MLRLEGFLMRGDCHGLSPLRWAIEGHVVHFSGKILEK
jgi:hypothetical protein